MLRQLAFATSLAAGIVVVPCPPLIGQDLGLLGGIVVDDVTGRPVPGAMVGIPRLAVDAVAAEDGRFLVGGLPAGPVEVRVAAAGYVTVVEQVELSAAAFIQVRLSRLRAVLDTVLVIAGRRRSSASVGDIALQDDTEPWRSVLDLIEDQVPGVVVRRDGGNVGTGAAIYFRGVTSFQGSNAPQIYLDGIRLDGRTAARSLHVLDVIPADEVARIRILKGASGPVGFGGAGANGAIVIDTRRGAGSGSPPVRR